MKTVCIFSGGLDSSVLLHELIADGHVVDAITFDYGQRHRKEIDIAADIAEQLGIRHEVVDISSVGRLLIGSSLTDNILVPKSGYDRDTMRLTVVPNRNAIMLAIACGIAMARKATMVATAVHGGDHYIYPDCRPDFIDAFQNMQTYALADMGNVEVFAPYVMIPKSDIVRRGDRLQVPFAKTWSCYNGGELHCGVCGTCRDRQSAFAIAGVIDNTVYAIKG